MSRKLRVFLCHASQDKPAVRELYKKLAAEKWIEPWLDEENLLPGQDFDLEIYKAARDADAIIICLSKISVAKEGYVNKEIRRALDAADEKPEGAIYIIPLRLDDCSPSFERLKKIQWVDYFTPNAHEKLIKSLRLRAGMLKIGTSENVVESVVLTKPVGSTQKPLPPIQFNPQPRAPVRKNTINLPPLSSSLSFLWKGVKTVFVLSLLLACIVFVLLPFWPRMFSSLPTTPTAFETPTKVPLSPEGLLAATEAQMLLIPAGEFIMGSNDPDYKIPIHTVYLSDYYMDKYEVTNTAYKRCVDTSKCLPPEQNNSSTRSTYYGNSEFDEYPVIYVNWNMAKTYCEWRDAHLPTDAQWEKAARGTDGRTYPWGESISCERANYNSEGWPYYCIGDTTKVGSYVDGISPYGVYDMIGNVWEWVSDWVDIQDYYKNPPSVNPLGPDSGSWRVLRGSSWNGGVSVYDTDSPSRFSRFGYFPNNGLENVGFRCARSQ